MVELYVIFCIGFVAYRLGWLGTGSRPVLTNLLLYVTLPSLIISSLHVPFDRSVGVGIGVLILLSVYFLATTAIYVRLMSKWLRLGSETAGVFQNLLLFGNQGFIGVAMVTQLLGPDYLFLAMVFNLVYFIFIWTYGIWLMKQTADRSRVLGLWKNPGLLATLIGLCFFFLPISLPPFILHAVSNIGQMTVPLSMLVIGCFTASIPIGEWTQYMRSKLTWLIVVLRLIVLPLLFMIPVLFLGLPFEWIAVALVLSATPCAPTICLFAETYGGDTKLATVSVLLTTLAASGTVILLLKLVRLLEPLLV
ncbi:AEC family transporter [Alkalihalobacillus sp. FSL W8-0930]